MPGFGPIAGAALSIYNGSRAQAKARDVAALTDQRDKAIEAKNFKSVLNNFPTNGMGTPSFYMGRGGKVGASAIKYKAEGEEVIMHQPTDKIKTDSNGSTQQLSSDMSKFTGDKHTAQSGGIGVDHNDQAFIFSDQIGLPETLSTFLKKLKL